MCFPRKFISKTTSKSFISITIKLARSITPLIIIEIFLRKNYDINISLEDKAVLRSLEVLSKLILILRARLVDMKEFDAPESNNVYIS